METILIVITFISLATAALALTAARRVRRGEQERSEARVAALAAAAESHEPELGIWDSGLGIGSPTRSDRIPNPESLPPRASITRAPARLAEAFGEGGLIPNPQLDFF